jgi:hypothetical protein
MRLFIVAVAVLLAACTGTTQVRGRYAAQLSESDIRQIRDLVAPRPHWGHRVIVLRAIRSDRVEVEARDYEDSSYSGIRRYVFRRGRVWHIDEHSPIEGIAERTVTIY